MRSPSVRFSSGKVTIHFKKLYSGLVAQNLNKTEASNAIVIRLSTLNI